MNDTAVASDTRAVGGSFLDELVRDGARKMLAAALQVEVAAYIDAHADLVDEQAPATSAVSPWAPTMVETVGTPCCRASTVLNWTPGLDP